VELRVEPGDIEQGFAALCARVSNWDRWGEDDELGTLNYVTPEVVRSATSTVREGRVVALGIPLGGPGPQRENARRFDPLHWMTSLPTENIRPGAVGASDDVLLMPLQAATQWDSLAHIAHHGRLYGGRPADSVTASAGALVNSIRSVSHRVATRGVLLDLARHAGVDSLRPGQSVGGAQLDSCAAAQGVTVRPGDLLLVRTGFLESCRRRDWSGYAGDSPGLDLTALEFLHEHRVAGVASDTSAVEVKPFCVPGQTLPFHVAAIVYMGLLIGEIFDLEALAEACAADKSYDGLLVAPPLPVTGGVGSPVNPYLIR
jgi:kynurenine formamidase